MNPNGMKKILTVTLSPAIDKSTSVDVVMADRKLRCDLPRYEPGGGGINVSRALKKLGYPSIALYPTGGSTGKSLDRLLDAEGIDRIPIKIKDQVRVNLTVLERSSGQQYRFGFPGQKLTDRECKELIERIKQARPDFIVASGSLPRGVDPDFYTKIIEIGRELGAKTILDTSGEALRNLSKERFFLLKVNLSEFRDLTGEAIGDDEELAVHAKRVVEEWGINYLVVSLGAGGAFACWSDGKIRVHSPPVPVRSKIGAGDSMVAGIVLKFAMGKGILDALSMGVAAGASAVMTEGTELCRREDSLRLYRTIIKEMRTQMVPQETKFQNADG
ncbi:MAG: 1-phosphofructokinase family hexose kinase [Candidatus Caldarchaeum sp.]